MLTDAQKAELAYSKAASEAWNADPIVTVSEWADEKRILPSKASAEPGPYRTDRTPYMREVMDNLSASSAVSEVVLCAGAQTGKSEAGNNWVGYVIDHAPGPMLLVQSTVENAKRYSKQRIGPMINETPALTGKVVDNVSREAGNNLMEKEFPGGILLLGGANSAAGLRSMPIRYLFADEISNWPPDVDGEGDPLALASARTNTFSRRKIYKVSTPKLLGACRITAEYDETDQRKYHVPCPHCGHLHELVWANFCIPKDGKGRPNPAKAHMVCPDCGCVIDERHKAVMLPELGHGGQARWVATCPDKAGSKKRGYQLSSLYAPLGWQSWAEIALQWLNAQGNPKRIQTFWNNVLALAYTNTGDRQTDDVLFERAKTCVYAADPLPDGVVLLTAGTDTQPDRLETEIVGWGAGEETWSIDYIKTYGNPDLDDVWRLHDANVLNRIYTRTDGIQLRVARCCVDTGGTNTVGVYQAVKARLAFGVMLATKGMAGDGRPIMGNPSSSNIEKIPLFPIGTFPAKDLVMGRLKIEDQGPGYCNFPSRYPLEYFKGLTAEEVRINISKKGFPVREWYKVYERNEPLDCRVLATAAFVSLGVRIDELVEAMRSTEPPPQGRRVRAEMSA